MNMQSSCVLRLNLFGFHDIKIENTANVNLWKKTWLWLSAKMNFSRRTYRGRSNKFKIRRDGNSGNFVICLFWVCGYHSCNNTSWMVSLLPAISTKKKRLFPVFNFSWLPGKTWNIKRFERIIFYIKVLVQQINSLNVLHESINLEKFLISAEENNLKISPFAILRRSLKRMKKRERRETLSHESSL